MNGRVLLLVSLLSMAALAGCTARAFGGDAPDTGQMLDASAAYRAAYDVASAIEPDPEFLGIRGAEGALPEGSLRYWLPSADLKEDGIADGVIGDGLVSSWVADFRVTTGTVAVTVFGDGRDPETHLEDSSFGKHHDGDATEGGRADASSWLISSSDAAAIALADPDMALHVATYPNAGYVYQYVPYSPKYPTYDWSMFFMSGFEEEPKSTGWSISGNSWLITHFDPAGWVGSQAPTVAVTSSDAATGKLTSFEAFVPRTVEQLYEGGDYADPMVPESLEPYVHKVPIEVPAGTGSLGGALAAHSFQTVGTGIGVLPDTPSWTLFAPDGSIAAQSTDEFGFDDINIADPPAGTWMLHVTHDRPTPQTITVMGWLWGSVPVTAETSMFG